MPFPNGTRALVDAENHEGKRGLRRAGAGARRTKGDPERSPLDTALGLMLTKPVTNAQKLTVASLEQVVVPASQTRYVYDPPPRLLMLSVYAPSLAVVAVRLSSR